METGGKTASQTAKQPNSQTDKRSAKRPAVPQRHCKIHRRLSETCLAGLTSRTQAVQSPTVHLLCHRLRHCPAHLPPQSSTRSSTPSLTPRHCVCPSSSRGSLLLPPRVSARLVVPCVSKQISFALPNFKIQIISTNDKISLFI